MNGFNRVDSTANRLRIAMQTAEKKQADVVRETGINRSAISRYLSGEYEPKSDAIWKLARCLDVDEMWLWGYECPKERKAEQKEVEKKADTITDAVLKMKSDAEFLSMVENLTKLDEEQRAVVKQLISALLK